MTRKPCLEGSPLSLSLSLSPPHHLHPKDKMNEWMWTWFSLTPPFSLGIGKYRIAKEKIEPIKGLHKLTKWIEDRGLKRAAVTNAPRENAELMISLLGLSDFFQAVILGSDCEHAKPFPHPYLKALEILKVSKEHTCVFEVWLHLCSPLNFLVDWTVTEERKTVIKQWLKMLVKLIYTFNETTIYREWFHFSHFISHSPSLVQDSVSGIKAGVAAGLPTVGLTTRNPAELLMEANPALLIQNYEDPKLWTILDELDKMAGVKTVADWFVCMVDGF